MNKINNLIFLSAFFLLISCSDKSQTEKLFQYFINKHVERIKPIQKNMNEAIWATYTGKTSYKDLMLESHRMDSIYIGGDKSTEYYQRLLNNMYDNSSEFDVLMRIKKSGLLSDSLLKRQFVKVYREYVSIQNNWDKTEKKKLKLFEEFYKLKNQENRFWDSIGKVPENEGRTMWIEKFSMLTGKFRDMIKAMNDDVKRLGYDNFFQSTMDYYDVPYVDLDRMIQVIDNETREDYSHLLEICKSEICKEFHVTSNQISPFQYRYSHEKMMAPAEWEKEYSQEEFIKLIETFYDFGDYDISDIYKNSDIWYEESKTNNSFFLCIDIDKRDFRIYSNIKPTACDLSPTVHEFGHALHYKSVDQKVPYLLKEPHTILAEAVAIYFECKLFTSKTVQEKMGLNPIDKNPYFKEFKNPSELFFIRKLLRNIKFEMAIFENPDQDFNDLWWKLNKDYLFFDASPTDRLPEWISNQQIVDFNGLHVFYLYAIALAAQLEAYYPDQQIAPIKDKIMKYGDSKSWNDLIKLATGEELNLNYLIRFYKREINSGTPVSLIFKGSKNVLPAKFSYSEKMFSKENS
jgi:peptidyl-dipeptidase A